MDKIIINIYFILYIRYIYDVMAVCMPRFIMQDYPQGKTLYPVADLLRIAIG